MKRKIFRAHPVYVPGLIIIAILASFVSFSGRKNAVPDGNVKELAASLRKLDYRAFQNPPSFFYPGFFWSWNDTLTREVIKEQLADMASHGVKNIVPVPMPRDFRPVNMPTLLEPDYMTDRYLEMYRFTAEQCKKEGLKLWLYDEGGWPSGSCLGKVVAANPSLVRQSLTRRIETPSRGTVFEVPTDCLAAFQYDGSKRSQRLQPGTKQLISSDNARIMIFRIARTGNYPDLLKPESTAEFLRQTHEKYRNYISGSFGNTVQITFTDEAKAANPGWTDDITEAFRKEAGYELINVLPSLFEGDSMEDQKVRMDYFNWWSRRHADSYYGQIQEWCHKNNLLSGGHLDGEDATINARRSGYGHPLRALRKMDVPGVDVIWRQLWPGIQNHHFPKYASTTAHQSGMPWSFTESFAVYGFGVTPAQMKWISDYQYVRGINLMIVSGYTQSMKDWFSGGLRPVFRNENPLWPSMKIYNDYMARISYLLSSGKPDIAIAVYYPARDIWAGGPQLEAVCSSNDRMARVLLENQCDFDFIDDDMLESDSTTASGGFLQAGKMRYEAVCISGCRYMSLKAAEKLGQFVASGGKVFVCDAPENAILPEGSQEVSFTELPARLRHTIRTTGNNSSIRVLKRKADNGAIYFVTNEDTCSTSGTLVFDEKDAPVEMDPETGICYQPAGASHSDEGWQIPVNMEFAGSRVYFFTTAKLPLQPAPVAAGATTLKKLNEGWTICKQREFIVGTHSTRAVPVDGKPVTVSIGDWRKALGNEFSGDAEYTISFKCPPEIAGKAVLLDLGDVRYVCSATLNGTKLGKKIRPPYAFDIRGSLKEDNILKVTVTNTLANQYIYNTKAFGSWTANQLGPYHVRQLAFEKESVPSGLFGPVVIK